jgi:hypothetical protein
MKYLNSTRYLVVLHHIHKFIGIICTYLVFLPLARSVWIRMSNHFARGIAPSAVESRETREARESRETRNRCYRCGATDLVIDAKAADRICRSCGEVQAACLIDTEEEFRLYPDDSDDGKSTQRSSGAGDSVSGDRFVFVGSNPDELALLARSAYSVLAIREKAIVEVTSVCKDISYALNLTKRITVSWR